MYYPCSKNKGTDQLHGYCEGGKADLRHEAAHLTHIHVWVTVNTFTSYGLPGISCLSEAMMS